MVNYSGVGSHKATLLPWSLAAVSLSETLLLLDR
jgi:hypothetical protein